MATAVQVQYRRGTAAQIAAFTGAAGELAIDTTNNRVVVQDGTTAGGFAAAKLSEVLTSNRTQVSDAAYTALATDRTVAYIALSAARAVTLPAASAFPTGLRLLIVDQSGNCSATDTISVSAAGADTISGATSAVIAAPYGYVALESNGSNKWTIVDQSTGSLGGLFALGIGTAADPSNPLSVTAGNILFNQSTGDIRIKLNKAASTNTASFIFQDGFAERAEIGLTGDDNFHFKVSPDGSTFYTGILIDKATGALTPGNARTPVADAAYGVLATDRAVAYASISAARIVTLPAAATYPAGVPLRVYDKSGAASGSNTITIQRAGSDTISGATSIAITAAYGALTLVSDGAGKWTVVAKSKFRRPTTSNPFIHRIGVKPWRPGSALSRLFC